MPIPSEHYLKVLTTSLLSIFITTWCSAENLPSDVSFQCSKEDKSFAQTRYNFSDNSLSLLNWNNNGSSIFGNSNGYSAQERCDIISQKLNQNLRNNNYNYIVPGYILRTSTTGAEIGIPALCLSRTQEDRFISCLDEEVLITLPSHDYEHFIEFFFNNIAANNPILIRNKNSIILRKQSGHLAINFRTLLSSLTNSFDLQHDISSSTPSQEQSLCNKAENITVKIIKQNSWGTGILIQKQDNNYFLLTNYHVLDKEIFSYSVQTFDGKTHKADVVKVFSENSIGENDLDLAVLKFQSLSDNYQVASPQAWQENEQVMAIGFPTRPPIPYQSGELYCTELADVSFYLEKPMKQGYQIGYPLTVLDGMSGGPLLSENGNLVGINGKGKPNLFINPSIYSYRDNTLVEEPLDLLSSSSWSIPIETIANHPNLQFLGLNLNASQDIQGIEVIENIYTQQNIEIPEDFVVMLNTPNSVNGAGFSHIGVIVKKDDRRFYVISYAPQDALSLNHTIETYDGRSYRATLRSRDLESKLGLYYFESTRLYIPANLSLSYSPEISFTRDQFFSIKWFIDSNGEFTLNISHQNLPVNQNNALIAAGNRNLVGISLIDGEFVDSRTITLFMFNNRL